MDLNKEKIGFIGLGIMGLPMASNLIKDEFNLVIYNRTLSKCTQLEDKGAVVAQTPADVAKNAKVIITMVNYALEILLKWMRMVIISLLGGRSVS